MQDTKYRAEIDAYTQPRVIDIRSTPNRYPVCAQISEGRESQQPTSKPLPEAPQSEYQVLEAVIEVSDDFMLSSKEFVCGCEIASKECLLGNLVLEPQCGGLDRALRGIPSSHLAMGGAIAREWHVVLRPATHGRAV